MWSDIKINSLCALCSLLKYLYSSHTRIVKTDLSGSSFLELPDTPVLFSESLMPYFHNTLSVQKLLTLRFAHQTDFLPAITLRDQ